MGHLQQEIPYYTSLDATAEEVIRLLSEMLQVNTIFLASNDQSYNYILKAFNRDIPLLKEGSVHPFHTVLCQLLTGQREPLVIPSLREHPLTAEHPVTLQNENGCFLGVPIYMEDGTMFGTLCAFDTKPYNFQLSEVKLVQTMGLLIARTVILEHHLIHDSLTGLYNRSFIKRYSQHLQEPAALLYVNLDRFQTINDTFGHDAGDKVLIEVKRRLVESVSERAVIARIGGDEYVVLLFGVIQQELSVVAQSVAKQILEAISSSPVELEKERCFLTASIGISYYPDDGQDMSIMLKKAASTMYIAKEKGKNTVQSYEQDVDSGLYRKYQLELALRDAITNEELFVVYQPQFDLKTERVVGFEALLRWQHPIFGLVSPLEFIPIAEETGFIRDIGYWVLREVCQQGVSWRMMGLPPTYLSVNLSPRQFEDQQLLERISEILMETGYDPNWLKVKITESLLAKNVVYTLETMQRLKKLGIHISIDDFGTGYSSLQYLVQFPIDCLKLDRSFIMNLEKKEHQTVATAIINLAHALNVIAVAEGIEEKDQLTFLQEQSCGWGQGFYYSKPLPAEEALHFYRNAHLSVRA